MSFKNRARQKILNRIHQNETLRVEQYAAGLDQKHMQQELEVSTDRLLAIASIELNEELHETIEEDKKRRGSLLSFILGNKPEPQVKSGIRIDRDAMRSAVKQRENLSRVFGFREHSGSISRPNFAVTIAYYEMKPHERDVTQPDVDIIYYWKVGSINSSKSSYNDRIDDTTKIRIWNVGKDLMTGEEVEELTYQITTHKHQSGTTLADLRSWTDGTEDDKYIQVANNSHEEALYIINTAIAELRES